MRVGFERVIAVGAHPDDVEIGCLGTLLKLGRPECETHVFVGCLGSPGDPSTGAARAGETRAAFECLELGSLTIREHPGITQDDFEPLLQQLTRVMNDVRPDLVLCHGPKDTHQEHRLMWEICLSAARRSQASILHYGTASSTADFSPNVWVDIEAFYDQKKRALKAHTSQADKDYMNPPHLDICHANTYASLHGIRCSEAFELFRGFL